MVRALGLAMVVVAVSYAATTLPGVRSDGGFDPLLDGGLQLVGQLLAAALATALWRRRRLSGLWGVLVVAIWLRVAGTVALVLTDPGVGPGVVPETLWLASTIAVVAALVVRVRARARRLSVLPIMDSVAGGAAVVSAALSLLYLPLLDVAHERGPAVTALSLAHAVAGTVVVVCIVALLAATGFRPPLARGLLAAGLVAVAVADAALRYRAGSSGFDTDGWSGGLTLVGMALVAAAFAVPDDPGRPLTRPPGLWLPVVYVLVATAVMVAAAYSEVPAAALPLAVVAILIEVARGVRTVSLASEMAERRLSAARVESWRFQSLAESSSDLIAMMSLDGRVEYLNPAGHRIAGIDPGQAAALRLTDLLTPDGLRGWETMQHVLAARGWVQAELELQGRGAQVPVLVSAFHLHDQEGGTQFAVGVLMHDITVRRGAQEEAARLSDERRELLRRLVLAQEEERMRVAADIHDDSVQVLASLALRLSLLEDKLAPRAPELNEDLQQVITVLEHAMQRLRHLMFDLDSPARRGLLDESIEQAAGHILGPGTTWTLDHQVAAELSEETRVTAYRIVVEALTNVRRHAGASQVAIEVWQRDATLLLSVSDDGRGVGPTDLRPRAGHLGVAAMQDRARASGGSLLVTRIHARGGTLVRVELPIETERPSGGGAGPERADAVGAG